MVRIQAPNEVTDDRPADYDARVKRRATKEAPSPATSQRRGSNGEATSRAELRSQGESPGPDDGLTYAIRSRRYPFLVEGRVEGLPFCLVEEGETWRFVVSRDPTVDPRSIASSRDGFVVGGRVALLRVQGEGPEMTDDHLHDLIDISRGILERRYREGRANDTPGLVRSGIARRPG